MTAAESLSSYAYALTVTGALAMSLVFFALAAERKPLWGADRAMFVALFVALTVLAMMAFFEHNYRGSIVCALLLALLGAAARTAVARSMGASARRRPVGASPRRRRWH